VCQILAPPQGVGAVAVVWICGAIYLIAIRAWLSSACACFYADHGAGGPALL